ncbi:hypothetical protein BC830DRAFT_1163957 [Chytriomyces sp. MP71]|nr:hypothetical protein BC830DRAFT_1163957 [Chytriomyces sp. MP71]
MLFRKPENCLITNKVSETFAVTAAECGSASAILFFANLRGCTVAVETPCRLVRIEACEDTTFVFRARVVTQILECWKSRRVGLRFETTVLTIQADLVEKLDLAFRERSLFGSVVWTGCEGIQIAFDDVTEAEQFQTGFKEAQEQTHRDISMLVPTDQFMVRIVDGMLTNEVVVRIGNGGFATTVREDDEFVEKQKRDAERLAKALTPVRKPDGPAVTGKATKATEAFTNTPDIRDMFAIARAWSVSGPSMSTSSEADSPPTRSLLDAIGTVKPSQIRRRSVSVYVSVATPAVAQYSPSPPVNAPTANRRRLIDADKEEAEQNIPDADTFQLDNEHVPDPPIVLELPATLPETMAFDSTADSAVEVGQLLIYFT